MDKVFIAADHAGFDLKEKIKTKEFIDLGTHSCESVDYPDYASQLAQKIHQKEGRCWGILICGSGQGMCIRANKYPYVRAALCWDETSTRLARQHNDANVLCLGSRRLSLTTVQCILKVFFQTPFDGHARHKRRVEKLSYPL